MSNSGSRIDAGSHPIAALCCCACLQGRGGGQRCAFRLPLWMTWAGKMAKESLLGRRHRANRALVPRSTDTVVEWTSISRLRLRKHRKCGLSKIAQGYLVQ